jgi:hypothetical protein
MSHDTTTDDSTDTQLVRLVYGADGGIERAIGPADSRAELRRLVAQRSSYLRSLRLGRVVDAAGVDCGLFWRPDGRPDHVPEWMQ